MCFRWHDWDIFSVQNKSNGAVFSELRQSSWLGLLRFCAMCIFNSCIICCFQLWTISRPAVRRARLHGDSEPYVGHSSGFTGSVSTAFSQHHLFLENTSHESSFSIDMFSYSDMVFKWSQAKQSQAIQSAINTQPTCIHCFNEENVRAVLVESHNPM